MEHIQAFIKTHWLDKLSSGINKAFLPEISSQRAIQGCKRRASWSYKTGPRLILIYSHKNTTLLTPTCTELWQDAHANVSGNKQSVNKF